MPVGHIASLFNAQGPNSNCLTACAASSQAIGEATEIIRRRVAAGKIVIPAHPGRPDQMVVGIGKGLRTKVNASIGTSSDIVDIELEVRKARIAEEEGADTLMELSTGGDLNRIRREILAHSRLPVGNRFPDRSTF